MCKKKSIDLGKEKNTIAELEGSRHTAGRLPTPQHEGYPGATEVCRQLHISGSVLWGNDASVFWVESRGWLSLSVFKDEICLRCKRLVGRLAGGCAAAGEGGGRAREALLRQVGGGCLSSLLL